MQKTLMLKAAITAGLALVLVVPLEMIHSTVYERQARQAEVREEVAASFAGAQTLGGPVLVFPYTMEWVETAMVEPAADAGTRAPRGAARVKREFPRRTEGRWLVLPTQADWDTKAATDFKHRGLFKTLVYDLTAKVTGRFEVPAMPTPPGVTDKMEKLKVTWGTPFVSLAVTDSRGLANNPRLTLGGRDLGFTNGSGLAALPDGIRAEAPGLRSTAAQSLPFTLDLAVRGTESLNFLPLAETTRVALASAWPHPSFGGSFLPLPRDQQGGADGFSARWEVTALASRAPAEFAEAVLKNCGWADAGRAAFGVRFIEPVNVYSMADRALKYGFLFVALCFAAFFLFELVKRLRIHPAQYLLVGLGLAIFFLLLLSLSEQVPFGLAYLLAASASIALQGFYLSHVLGSVRRGLGFAGLLAALFGALFGLLVDEDTALLMGSLLLFGLLALAMVLTRRLDWYGVGLPERTGGAAVSP